ncbi:lactonase family protein [Paenibacillus radicis (ex Xue et al. 2023)]|uniref:Lactonase family protein n=1 Tax=Paenibacillus radicis (ex Xue et al. 2023) TaxID=2972489 RepID=A0ABT1YLZ8_9BACL|nr:lactonase family protein [Paenibacillus radicis (ex Xue et al. 2023)]MCR8633419.1 lactonase family protein [Paenibacillus radicis (ex Xue et al. 2023)]
MYVYAGCMTAEASPSLYLCEFHEEDGSLTLVNSYNDMSKTSYLVVDASRNILYVVGMDFENEGIAVSYIFNPDTKQLQLVSKQATLGKNPIYVSTDPDFTALFAANFTGGSIIALPLKPGGIMEDISCCISFEVHRIGFGSKNKSRPHSIVVDPTNRFVVVPDLGTDRLYIYEIDYAHHDLKLKQAIFVEPGSGPRHFLFHPTNHCAYMINEYSSTITIFTHDASQCVLETIQTVSTLPADFDEFNKCADIQLSACGKYVYGSNRGHDSIVQYRINEDGRLTYVGHVFSGGNKPRSMAVSPSGKYMLVANEGANHVASFAINQHTGELTPAGQLNLESSPICINFMI